MTIKERLENLESELGLENLEREEFVQNYLQYRWLDETRTKFMDRFFVVLLAVLVARFQSPFLDDHPGWRAVLYGLFVLLATFMAKSIVSFRRQQRGHGLYIKAIRRRILDRYGDSNEFSGYKKYVEGKPVYLTTWIEFVVALMATVSPLLFLDIIQEGCLATAWCGVVATGVILLVMVAIAWFVMRPFFRYNREKVLDSYKE